VKKNMNCPSCHRLLYSRKHSTCGFCGAELPPEVLFTEAEIAAIKAAQEDLAMRRAKAKAKEEEERAQAANGGSAFMFPPIS
jgi:hypothetical protein